MSATFTMFALFKKYPVELHLMVRIQTCHLLVCHTKRPMNIAAWMDTTLPTQSQQSVWQMAVFHWKLHQSVKVSDG